MKFWRFLVLIGTAGGTVTFIVGFAFLGGQSDVFIPWYFQAVIGGLETITYFVWMVRRHHRHHYFRASFLLCLGHLFFGGTIVYTCGLAVSGAANGLNLNLLGANLCFYGLIASVAVQFILPYTNERKVW
jgi:hypothetical protein